MIRMTKRTLLIGLAVVSLPGLAQIYTWKDETGRTVISDKPPAGKKVVPKTVPSDEAGAAQGTGSGESAATAKPANGAKTGVDPELEKRKREQEARAKAEKQQKDQQKEKEAEAVRQENCRIAKRGLAPLESGDRISLRDEKGERYYMEDAQRATEIQRLRGIIAENCK